MKTVYEKTKKLCYYIIDLMYMQRYYLDVYDGINTMYVGNKKVIKRINHDDIRSYSFVAQSSDCVFNSIQQKSQNGYSTSVLMTITDSKHHVNNNTGKNGLKYCYVHNPGSKLGSTLTPDMRFTYDLLIDSIASGTQKEAEFQALMVSSEFVIKSMYIYSMLNDALNAIQTKNDTILCLTSTDILRYIPARKAYCEMLDKRLKHENDWRSEIKDRYGHIIK